MTFAIKRRTPFFSFAIESYIYETDWPIDGLKLFDYPRLLFGNTLCGDCYQKLNNPNKDDMLVALEQNISSVIKEIMFYSNSSIVQEAFQLWIGLVRRGHDA